MPPTIEQEVMTFMPPQSHDATKSVGTPGSAAPRRMGRPLMHAPEDERSMMIAAVYGVLARQHSGSIRVSEICAEAGLSTRSFYRHFKSKDDLLLAMFQAEMQRVEDELAERMERSANPAAAVGCWVRFTLALTFDPRRRKRALIMKSPDVTRAAGYAASLARIQERHRVPLVLALRAGAADGSFRHTDPSNDAAMIQDIVTSVMARRRDGVEEGDAESALTTVLDFLSRAIGMRD
jgi:AcrR family transcriptional regulator